MPKYPELSNTSDLNLNKPIFQEQPIQIHQNQANQGQSQHTAKQFIKQESPQSQPDPKFLNKGNLNLSKQSPVVNPQNPAHVIEMSPEDKRNNALHTDIRRDRMPTESVAIKCQFCSFDGRTIVTEQHNLYLLVCIIFCAISMIFLIFLCCMIPNWQKSRVWRHKCANCFQEIGFGKGE